MRLLFSLAAVLCLAANLFAAPPKSLCTCGPDCQCVDCPKDCVVPIKADTAVRGDVIVCDSGNTVRWNGTAYVYVSEKTVLGAAPAATGAVCADGKCSLGATSGATAGTCASGSCANGSCSPAPTRARWFSRR